MLETRSGLGRWASALLLVSAGTLSACNNTPPPQAAEAPKQAAAAAPSAPTAEEATAFIVKVNADLKELWGHAERIAWVKNTYITFDTETLMVKAEEEVMEYMQRTIKEAQRFEGLDLPPETARMFYLLKFAAGLPAPELAEERTALAEISTKLTSIYGKGKYCSAKFMGKGRGPNAEGKDDGCRNLNELSEIIANYREWEVLQEAWTGWRTISTPMRPMYEKFVELGKKGAKEIGFADMAEIWQGRYDMTGPEFRADMDRIWGQVKPLYEQVHCYVRGKLQKKYGKDKIPDGSKIPAHLLGNMWAQEWAKIYDLVEPFPGKGQPDVTRMLQKKKFDAKKMVETAEGFFTSMGMNKLPETFWERSQFLKPRDREVVCHASAWDVGMSGDLRIKMCIKVDEEDLVTIHHELGHNYYFMYYETLPALFQQGANDGFHEGIGDTLALSVTPKYLKQVGITDKVLESKEADINLLMKRALEGIAFLPFGKLIDEWRWDVFSGKVSANDLNAHWWKLRNEYQGIQAPVERTEADFDPGAKYHIPANVPYTRYFIARILQYQFLRALCKDAGHEGPLFQCSIYGSEKAGDRLKAMLALGASKPWPDALEAITGERQMDATAIIDYYQPLMDWLAAENKGQQCGW